MKVSELPYTRVTREEMDAGLRGVIAQVQNAACADDAVAARETYIRLMARYMTASVLANIRYTCNTTDAFYVAERDYYDEIGPEVASLANDYGAALLHSPFRAELERKLSPVLFRHLESSARAMSPAIVPDMVEENRLISAYSELMAGMEFAFRGEKMSRAMLTGYFKSGDRATRQEAYAVLGTGMNAYRDQLDEIFDKLVHVRDRMAKKMGYRNFTELGYYRMDRICYGRAEVEEFRRNVKKTLAPAVARLRTENGKKLGLDRYMLYDEDVIMPGGDPRPVGGKEGVFRAAEEMYHAMGRETGDFIDLMMASDAFDVEARRNKWGGGYMTYLPEYRQPFILANFNGSAGDVDVMTHEAGHAFAGYLIADNRFALDIEFGGMETAETHSMGMEFFAWKYIDKFFGADADRYKYMHALKALSFIPYGCAVDEFQHIIYENPDMTPAQRCEAWNRLEGEYRPHIATEGMPFLEEGRRWQYQMHIYETPFYYIDYCLAQTAAFGFLLQSLRDYDGAFAAYVRFAKQGGETLFTDLLAQAQIPSPFAPGALDTLTARLEQLLKALSEKAC